MHRKSVDGSAKMARNRGYTTYTIMQANLKANVRVKSATGRLVVDCTGERVNPIGEQRFIACVPNAATLLTGVPLD